MRATLAEKRKKIYVVITYEDSLGQTKKKWFGTGLNAVRANRKEANRIKEEKLEEFKQIYKFADNKKSTMLFADFITDWLERVKPNLQISTYSTYAMQVKEIADYFRIKKIKLLDLQPLDIANFYAYLQKQGKSVQKCEHLHVNIRKCLQSAVKANLIPYNPADRIDRPKSPIHISQFYNKEELEIEESGRDKKITGTKPRYISKVKHRDNSTTVELDYKQTPENVEEILEENQIEKPIKEKSVKVYVNVDTGYLGTTKRFSDLEDNHKFLKEIKSTEEANDFIVELFCSGEYDKNDLKEYRSRLLKKVKEICEDSEM